MTDIQAAIGRGNMGSSVSTLTTEEVQAIADVLPPSQGVDPGPDYSDCTACHGQPPSTGAHDVHFTLGLGSTVPSCGACHDGAAHNSQVDLGFPAGFDAESGPATDNLDGTCSSVKCHGNENW